MSSNTQVNGWLNQLRSLSASEWCHDISSPLPDEGYDELGYADLLAEETPSIQAGLVSRQQRASKQLRVHVSLSPDIRASGLQRMPSIGDILDNPQHNRTPSEATAASCSSRDTTPTLASTSSFSHDSYCTSMEPPSPSCHHIAEEIYTGSQIFLGHSSAVHPYMSKQLCQSRWSLSTTASEEDRLQSSQQSSPLSPRSIKRFWRASFSKPPTTETGRKVKRQPSLPSFIASSPSTLSLASRSHDNTNRSPPRSRASSHCPPMPTSPSQDNFPPISRVPSVPQSPPLSRPALPRSSTAQASFVPFPSSSSLDTSDPTSRAPSPIIEESEQGEFGDAPIATNTETSKRGRLFSRLRAISLKKKQPKKTKSLPAIPLMPSPAL